jgi:hypothetical protein
MKMFESESAKVYLGRVEKSLIPKPPIRPAFVDGNGIMAKTRMAPDPSVINLRLRIFV